MVRVLLLRMGYGALGLAFLALAATPWVGTLLVPSFALGFLGALLLVFSEDDLPRWAGVALLAYSLLTVAAFLVSTGLTIKAGGDRYAVNPSPPRLGQDIFYWLGLSLPLAYAVGAAVAQWAREWPSRWGSLGAAGGFVLLALLTLLLSPGSLEEADLTAAQGRTLERIFALSALVGALAAAWATVRPEEEA